LGRRRQQSGLGSRLSWRRARRTLPAPRKSTIVTRSLGGPHGYFHAFRHRRLMRPPVIVTSDGASPDDLRGWRGPLDMLWLPDVFCPPRQPLCLGKNQPTRLGGP
jgi:hypothetical protein